MSKPQRSLKAKLKIGAIGFFIITGLSVLAGSAYFMREINDAEAELPKLSEQLVVADSQPSEIVSDDGVVLYKEIPQHREYRSFNDIPQTVLNATLAAEDKRFLAHDGVDYWAMGRIFFIALTTRRASQGGSTITMQIAKHLGGSTKKTMSRKVKDMALAIAIERKYSKHQILEMYLNQSFFGSGA